MLACARETRAGCCAQGAAISLTKESGKWKRPTKPKRGKEEKSRRGGRTADDPVVCTFFGEGVGLRASSEKGEGMP